MLKTRFYVKKFDTFLTKRVVAWPNALPPKYAPAYNEQNLDFIDRWKKPQQSLKLRKYSAFFDGAACSGQQMGRGEAIPLPPPSYAAGCVKK